MKLGAYGCLRVAMTLFPQGMDAWIVEEYTPNLLQSLAGHSVIQNIQWALHCFGFNSWREIFSLLAVIGIVYGAMVALVQKDFKFVIGYSSVSHMGFVLLGLMTLNLTGLNGAVLQMFSHGIIASLLFAVVGRMVYDRTHTRELSDLGVMNLNQMIPFAAVTFTLASVASMGLPGFSGFVAELQVLIGAWHLSPTLAVVAGFGILVGVAYTLRTLFLAFFHDAPAAGSNAACQGHLQLAPITVPERIGAVLLIGISLLIGLCPRLLLDLIGPSFSSPLFDGLRKVCGM
jgi:NADH-quinone oxidoreductase subunit M